MPRIEVDWPKCNGNGMCEAEAPELFEIDDNGDLQVLNWNPSEEQREQAETAIEMCPTEALRLKQD